MQLLWTLPLLLLVCGAVRAGEPSADLPFSPLIDQAGPSREVILAGGGATHFACETRAENQRAYHGLYVRMHEFLDSWTFLAGRRAYVPDDATVTEVRPDGLTRRFSDGASEEIFLPRELAGLLLVFNAARPERGLFRPRVDFRHIWDVPTPEYNVTYNERLGALLIRRTDFDPPPGVPRVMVLLPESSATWVDEPAGETRTWPRDAARRAMARSNPWRPGYFSFQAEPDWPWRLAVGLGDSESEAFSVAREILDDETDLRHQSHTHRAKLAETVPRTGIARIDSATVWARWSLDNLTMNARGPGIYAGYHWFSNYWGRDSFISLPGACLVSGDFELAREILLSFAGFQLNEPGHPRLGRLPNIVNPDNLQYAGVDGTWWWVRAVRLYLDATGDRDLLQQVRPVVERAVAGALAQAVDRHGLLKHGDGETWMDAGGEHNPFSPRGDRAVEVQVLWLDGLRTAALLADWSGDEAAGDRYRRLATKTHRSLLELFPRHDGLGLADHLDVDGKQDRQIRPNQIFALTLPRFGNSLWDKELSAEILTTTVDHLVLPHGVTSLDPADPAWLPRHLDLDDHYYDEAYHNGDVWLWLSGPVIQALCEAGRADEAWAMLTPLTRDLLDRGAMGTLREIRDGAPNDLHDFGGATSQAWSLAEYLRVFNEAWLGFHPAAMDREINWRPRLPQGVEQLTCPVSFGGTSWRIEIDGERAVWSPLSAAPESEIWTITLHRPGGGVKTRRIDIAGADSIEWDLK